MFIVIYSFYYPSTK